MHWTRFALAVLASGVAASFTDWFFMGFLFHGKYAEAPEIWRLQPGQTQTSVVAFSELIGLVACAAFIYLCHWTGALPNLRADIHMAAVAWVLAPVPLILTNVLWIKFHPLVGLSHMLGWLARFLVTGVIAYWLLPR
ncbi:MAG: hypothetical protein ACRD36_14350 [Candidatus Acidiferrum sp.]